MHLCDEYISALFSRIEPKTLKKKLELVYSKGIVIAEADILHQANISRNLTLIQFLASLVKICYL